MSKAYDEWKKSREETAKKGQAVWDELLKETATNIAAMNELKPDGVEGTYRLSVGLNNVDMETGKPAPKK